MRMIHMATKYKILTGEELDQTIKTYIAVHKFDKNDIKKAEAVSKYFFYMGKGEGLKEALNLTTK